MLVLVTNIMNGQTRWIEAPTVSVAVVKHESERREAIGRPALPERTRVMNDSSGDWIHVSCGESRCFGLRCNVIRTACSRFAETAAGHAFVCSAESRETSVEIMEAIAGFARTTEEAEALWNGDGFGTVCTVTDLWERVTQNGRFDPSEFCWGAAGRNWWDAICG